MMPPMRLLLLALVLSSSLVALAPSASAKHCLDQPDPFMAVDCTYFETRDAAIALVLGLVPDPDEGCIELQGPIYTKCPPDQTRLE